MKKANGFTKRMVAILLSGMLAVGTIPGTALAAEAQENTVQEEEAITTYAVTLDANGGYFENEWDDVLGDYIESTEILNKIIPVGGTVTTYPVFETDDQQTQVMSFSGWSLERYGEPVSQGDEEYIPLDNCVLYAVWEPAEIPDNDEKTDVPESDQAEGAAEDDSLVEQEDIEDNSDSAENTQDTEILVDDTEGDSLEDQQDTEDKSDDIENIEDTKDFSDESADPEEIDSENDNREDQSDDIIEEGKEESVRTDAAMSAVASGTCGDNLTWTLDSVGTLTISGTGEMDDYCKIKIGTYSGFTAGTLPPWFDMRDSIERIVISEGVTSIGTGAFTQAGANDMVEYISIPNSLTSIRDAAFAYTGCPVISFGDHPINFKGTYLGVFTYAKFDEVIWGYDNLNAGLFCDSKIKKITFTGNIKTIPNQAFSGCSSLISVSIPSGVEKIGESAFWRCGGLEDVAIPGTVETIEKNAFGYCDSLSKVTVGQGVKTIGESAFEGCKNLNQLKLPVGLTQIGRAAFTNCDSMEFLTIPEGVVIIDVIAFDGCDSLKSVTLPKSLVTIENGAFRDCPKLTKIDIPENVNSICTEYSVKSGKYSSFAGASSLVEINVASGNNTYMSFDGCLYNYDLTELLYCPEGKTSLLISPSTTSIDQSALRVYSFDGNITDINLKEIYFGTCSPSIPENLLWSVHKITAYYNNFLCNWLTEKRQNYGGTITWVEKALNLSECTMESDSGSYTYDGTAKKPAVTLTYSGKTLTDNTDYTVSYTNNVNAGTGTVTVSGKGSFTGSSSKTFTISKASPTLSFTSSSVSKTTTDSTFTNTLAKKTDGTVTFSSSNNSVATVNSSTGQVTIKGAGSATITANAAAGTNYNAGSASYTLTVVRQYTVSYDSNGGTGTPSSQIKQENVSIVLSDIKPTKKYTISYNSCGGSVSPASKSINCTFNNWNTSQNGSGTSYTSGGNYTANADTTLYAQWDNPKAGELAIPTRSGYAFDGWYTASSGGNQITDISTITGNVSIYAHWKDPYNIGDETYSFENYIDLDSNGHCFGMSITSAGYENNLLNIKRIGGNESTPLYSFNDTPIVREPICYYQKKQGSYSNRATVAGGSVYKTGISNIDSDWQEVINFVKNHKYDNTGLLQIGFRKGIGGHAINFLRYEYVNGQDRIYAYDNNFPNQETYFYKDAYGRILQAPVQTFRGAIDCIALRDSRIYYSIIGSFDSTRALYMAKDDAYVLGYNYSLMDGTPSGEEIVMYEIPSDQERVTIIPNRDNADFIYMDTEFSFGEITDKTRGELIFSSMDEQSGGLDASFIIYEEETAIIPTVTLSKSDFTYNGKEQKPTVTVKAGSTVLKEVNDYSVGYPSGMINVGTYKVTVTLKGNYSGVLFATFNINKAAQSLTVKSTASSIAVGKTATVSTTGNKGKVTYTSSNTATATVNASTGVVTGKKAGTVTITASAAATANYNAASKTVKITVTSNTSSAKVTGWQKIGGKWYYMNSNGVKVTGWQKIGGKWYYMNSSGVMTTGWQKIGGKWYYMNSSGVMTTGWQKIGGKWYYMNSSGVMTTGWQKIGGKWYYMNSSGVMTTGWKKIGGKWYYMNSSGQMVTGTQVIGGKKYVFNSSGVWVK